MDKPTAMRDKFPAMLNFVTNLSLSNTSGGWSGISANIFRQLRRLADVKFVGPIDPPYPQSVKIWSKLRRSVGLPGAFSFFDHSRLLRIAESYDAQRCTDAEFDLFHGATPWVLCNPQVPYGTYLDATFEMYLDLYLSGQKFDANDVGRICALERAWLHRSSAIFFGSDWMRQIAMRAYDLPEAKCHVAWVGGNVPVPTGDAFEGGRKFLFIALNFEKKGGRIAVEAIQKVRSFFPDAELVVIGQAPPEELSTLPCISYAGFLRKTVPAELETFCRLLAEARGLIHPTSMDTMGAVLIEAAYYGCPSIATRRFGIPELVLDRRTGILVDAPISVEDVANGILYCCKDEAGYKAMRSAAREHATRLLSWDAFGDRIAKAIASVSIAPEQ